MAVYVDEVLCKGCELCVKACSKGVLQISNRVNRKGFNVVGVDFIDKCNSCKLCEITCPDLALFVKQTD